MIDRAALVFDQSDICAEHLLSEDGKCTMSPSLTVTKVLHSEYMLKYFDSRL